MTHRGGAANFPHKFSVCSHPGFRYSEVRAPSPLGRIGTHLLPRNRDLSVATASNMIKKMSPSENEFDIPAKNCHRMVILGSTKVGKTAIISRFLNERFDDQYTPTIEDFHRKFYSIRGDIYQLDILDTSGNHPFPAMRRLSILTGELTFKTKKNPHHVCGLQSLLVIIIWHLTHLLL